MNPQQGDKKRHFVKNKPGSGTAKENMKKVFQQILFFSLLCKQRWDILTVGLGLGLLLSTKWPDAGFDVGSDRTC